MTTTDPFPPGLLEYFAAREQQRARTVQRALDTLNPYENRILREAAVMGYVRGLMAGRAGVEQPGPDADTVAEVVGACAAMADLYPIIAAAAEGLHYPSPEFDAYLRRWHNRRNGIDEDEEDEETE